MGPPYRLVLYQHSFAHFTLQFWVGVANPNLGEENAAAGRGLYRLKERWLVPNS